MRRLIWLAIGLLPGNTWADDMVIYRCTSASDVQTIQRMPCPEGSTQRVQRVADPARTAPVAAAPEAPPPGPSALPTSSPTATPSMATVTSASPRAGEERPIMEARMADNTEGDTILDSAMLHPHGVGSAADKDAPPKPPLPAIFHCVDTQGGTYLHEYEAAPGRCELLNVQGLGGATPVNAASCEVVRDRCTEVEQAQRCGSWQQRFRDARGRERFAASENQQAARGERERLQAVLEASNCPVPE
ncbi:MAG: hypothetical protein RR831_12795 [Stenotrophomonas sp.]